VIKEVDIGAIVLGDFGRAHEGYFCAVFSGNIGYFFGVGGADDTVDQIRLEPGRDTVGDQGMAC
jgi:hypothetical protein